MNTKNYKKVQNLFEGVSKNVKAAKNLIEKPYEIMDMGDYIYIREQVLMTLDDGIEVEMCCWSEADMLFCDVSIDKAVFDKSGNDDFTKYLESKGFFLENVEDNVGSKWRYCGTIEKNDCYGIQYYREDEE